MPRLADLALRVSYRDGEDDIAADFYLPCMARAINYERAVGYFRSTIFALSWPSLRDFVQRDGRIKVLCSHVLSPDDVRSLEEGYEARDAAVANALTIEIQAMLNDESLATPTRILAALVAEGILDLRIALLRDNQDDIGTRRRVFHDKLGLFHDSHGDVVVFKGSMNETWTGLSANGNLESVDVFTSWRGENDLERIAVEKATFARLWGDEFPQLDVVPFPQVSRDALCEAAEPDWQDSLDRLLTSSSTPHRAPTAETRELRAHQAAGLASWAESGRRGILAFVTGGGKTFTALTAIRESLEVRGEPVLVVVPDTVLFRQWESEMTSSLSDIDPLVLRAGAGHSDWKGDLGAMTRAGTHPRLVLATIQTASRSDFLELLRGGEHLMLVVDEVHRAGAPERQALLANSQFGPRLGLSATPERAGDPVGTSRILEFFGSVLEPRYSLAEAVQDGVLSPYRYQPHTTRLSDEEMKLWNEISADISKLYARLKDGDPGGTLKRRMKQKLIERSRVVKNARSKIQLAVSILEGHYAAGDRWLVYCDNQRQVEELETQLAAAGIEALPFHSAMEGDREATLAWLETRGGILLAIKCLDEGVDIPSVSHALILASSKNPREFIQRRGRVLRRAQGKAEASIHDVIVLAAKYDSNEGDSVTDPVLAGELGRAIEFSESAANPSAGAVLRNIALDAGIEWEELTTGGMEDEEEV